MSDRRIDHIPLEELFDFKRGNSKYTKKYCHLHKGQYEVYTGTTIGKFASIDTYDYSEPNLTYTTDGVYAGTVEIIKNEKYNIGGHRAVLKALDPDLDLSYFEYTLKAIFKKNVKDGSVPSLTWSNIRKLPIPVPVDSTGNYDVEEQKIIAEQFKNLLEKKENLQRKHEDLSESYIIIPKDEGDYKEVPLNELFDFKRGGGCTRAYCNQHKGIYPVWSANNLTPLAHIDTYKYDGRYISLSRNGIAGKITILDGKFTINEDRFLLIPKVDNIDYGYIRYTVEPVLRSKKKGRAGHNGENEFTKLSFTILNNTKIMMPISKNGEYDLERQREYAQKYDKIYKIKDEICKILESVISTEIVID